MYPKFSRFFHQIYCCKQTFLLQMQTFNSITRRLRLTFRPEMVFAKPVYGDPSPSTALVIRAKQLRNNGLVKSNLSLKLSAWHQEYTISLVSATFP